MSRWLDMGASTGSVGSPFRKPTRYIETPEGQEWVRAMSSDSRLSPTAKMIGALHAYFADRKGYVTSDCEHDVSLIALAVSIALDVPLDEE